MTSNAVGASYTAVSWLADPYDSRTTEPSGSVTPATSTSVMLIRAVADQIGDVQRMPSEIARGIRLGSSTTDSNWSGRVNKPTRVDAMA